MCIGDVTLEDLATITKANGDIEIWEQGVNIARNAQGKITKPFLAATDALRREWTTEVVNQINFKPELLLTGVQDLDWQGWATKIFNGWEAGTGQVLQSSTRASLVASGFEFTEPVAKQVIWAEPDKENQATLWRENRGANFITGISRSTRAAVEQVLERGIAENLPPRQVAKQVEAIIGLTPRDASAVLKRQQKLFDAGKKAKQVTRTIDAYRKKLLKARATTIARTELMAARNAGTLNAWRMAQAQGVAPLTAKKEWVLGPNACPICEAIVAEGPVELNQSFNSPANGMTYDAPPAHPRCRCSVVLV